MCTFEACSGYHSRYGPLHRSAAQGDLCRKAPARRLPGQAACQLPAQPTMVWVEPPSTGLPRLRGALQCGCRRIGTLRFADLVHLDDVAVGVVEEDLLPSLHRPGAE